MNNDTYLWVHKMSGILEALWAGLTMLGEYLSAHVVTCLIPAFFIAGAIAAMISKRTILKYFGSKVKKWVSYSVASVSGTILAVCSCTILPMFAGIYKRGGGIGPATTFLYSGPAINILAITLTASVLGVGLGIARAFSAILMSIVIGLIMASIFERKQAKTRSTPAVEVEETSTRKRPWYASPAVFVLLVLILLIAAPGYIPLYPKVLVVTALVIATVAIVRKHYSKDEVGAWMQETWWVVKKIMPILLIGVFITGVIAYFVPYDWVRSAMGGNIIVSCFVASIIGAILYMPTLLEVPIVGTILGYSQGVIGAGPALSLLLSGPAVSLPSMLTLWRIVGARKTGAYVLLVIAFSTILGVVFGMIL
jgi:hypothetical protein